MASLSNKVSKYPEEQWIPAQPAAQKKEASALDERKVMPAADIRQLHRPAEKGAMVKAEVHEVDPVHAQWLAQVDAVHDAWVNNKLSPEHKSINLRKKICYGPPGLRSIEFISTLIPLLFPPKADEPINLDEFGAGNAFWSYKFDQTGKFKVRALDSSHPNNVYRDDFPNPYYPVTIKPDVVPDVRKRAAESVLFASWLPPKSSAGDSCLEAYEEGKGKLFICEGEEEGGACANAAFFERLRTNWVRLGVPKWAQTLKLTYSQALQVYVAKDFDMNACEVPQDILDQKSYNCILTLLQFSLQARKILDSDSYIFLYIEKLNSVEDIVKMENFLKGLIPHMQNPKLAEAILLNLNRYIYWFEQKTISAILSADDQDSLETLKQIDLSVASFGFGDDVPQTITQALEELAKTT